MTDTTADIEKDDEAPPTFGSDLQGVRDAARDLGDRRERGELAAKDERPPADPPDRNGYAKVVPSGLKGDETHSSPREAAKALAEHRAAEQLARETWQATERLATEEAPQSEAPEAPEADDVPTARPQAPAQPASVEDQIKARAAMIEQARTSVARDAAEVSKNIRAMFPEIRFMSHHEAQDVAALAQANPERHQMLMRAVGVVQEVVARNQQVQTAEAELQQYEQQHTQQRQYDQWCAEQDRLVAEVAPELKKDERGNYLDPQKAVELQHKALAILRENWTDDQIRAAFNDGRLRDAGVQKMILDQIRYRDMQATAQNITAKPIPPVQRPGVSRPRGADNADELRRIEKRLETATSFNAARLAAKRHGLMRGQRGR